MNSSNQVYPKSPPWFAAIHATNDDENPLGCGVVIDERRVLTCRHVVEGNAPNGTLGEIWVTFPCAVGGDRDTRLRVEQSQWPMAPERPDIKDLVVLRLSAPTPKSVRPAPLNFPEAHSLEATRWWATGFPDGDRFGGTATGAIKRSLFHGWILLAADESPDDWVSITDGFSGTGLWSLEHRAVIAVISQENQGKGRAITLHEALKWFPGEDLMSLTKVTQATPSALPVESTKYEDSRELAPASEAVKPTYALMIWRKEQAQVDRSGRLFGETGTGEDVQLDADRMWWPIARWRLHELKALIFIVNGQVKRIREVYGIDEETTGNNSSLALNVSAPLKTDEIEERLPTLKEKLGAQNLGNVQGRIRQYLDLGSSPLQPFQSLRLSQLAHAIDTRFAPYLHQKDMGNVPPDESQLRLRGFAAMAARVVSGISDLDAAAQVTDSINGDGIDGFAIASGDNSTQPTIYLIKAKWSADGNHSFENAETGELINGFEKLINDGLHEKNLLRDYLPTIEQLRDDPQSRFVLVFASSGIRRVSPQTEAETRRSLSRYVREEIKVSYRFLNLDDFTSDVWDGLARGRGVGVSGSLLWQRLVEEDHLSLHGTISAALLGDWYDEHEEKLLDDNVRAPMDSDINEEIFRCLLEEPQNFWFFHVGVTALCESWCRAGKGTGPVPYDFSGLRIVNGAQTINSIRRALNVNRAAVEKAQVPIRFIRLDHAPPGFGAQVSRANNRSNPMSQRALMAMDHVQQRLRDEFALTWGKDYAIRDGDPAPVQEKGCSVQEAAIAMACARYGVTALMQVTEDTASLWATQGTAYRELFPEDVSPVEVWRRVQTFRRITDALDGAAATTTERGKSVAVLGRLIIAHLVMRRLGDDRIDDISSDWEQGWSRVPGLTTASFRLLTTAVNSQLTAGLSTNGNMKDISKRLKDGMWLTKQTSLILAHNVGFPTETGAEVAASWKSEAKFYAKIKHEWATGSRCDGGFLVHAGSPAATDEGDSLSLAYRRIRQNLNDSLGFKKEGDFLRLTRDALFTSPTRAASVLLGHMISGPDIWETENGVRFSKIYPKDS